MKFIDRREETDRLMRLAERRDGGLAVMWGRRRIGKTRILVEWCNRTGGIYTVSDQSAVKVQRRYLASALARKFRGFDDVEYPDWKSLFSALTRRAVDASWRGPVVFDEFPYLVAADPSITTVVQHWLDHEAQQAGLVVALAGSAQHMMHGLVMDAHSPLYGRAVESMQLGPIPAGYIGDALGVSDPVALLRAFSVWGGVPRYWELAAVFGQDLDMAVDDLVLSPLGPLHMEPDRILSAEMPSAHSLRPVLDVIGAGAHRVSEIGGRLGQPASSLSRPLARLVDLGMVRREKPFGALERGTKRTLYKIADPFLRTWFRVVAPRRAQLASVPSSIRRKIWSAEKAALFASAFEDICRDAVPGFYEKKNAPARIRSFGAAGRYWEAGRGEWDVVSLSMDGTKLLLGEVKWREKDADERFIKKALNELRSRGVPKKGAWSDLEVVHALFVPRVKKGVRKGHFGAAVVEAKDILRVIR